MTVTSSKSKVSKSQQAIREAALTASGWSEAKRVTGRAASAFRLGEEDQQQRGVTAAYATHASVTTGYLILGRRPKGAPKSAVTTVDYGQMFGVSHARVGQWAMAGRAFVVHGIDPTSDTGRAILNGRGTDKETRAAIMADTADEGTIRQAFARDDKAKRAAKDAAKAAKAKRNAEGKGGGKALRNNPARLDALEMIRSSLTALSPKEAKRLAEHVDACREMLAAKPEAPKPSRTRRTRAA
jgi:hypothetical protein